MNSSGSRQEIFPLTGVRGFAALWLVLYHLAPLFRNEFSEESFLWNFVRFGYLAVDLFAILSGFIIAYIYSERLSTISLSETRRYLWFRFVRTYPTHFFVLGLFVAVAMYQGSSSFLETLSDPAFLRQVFMVNGVGFEHQWAWNAPTWSLSSEWFCYLLFPVIALAISRIRNGLAAAALIILTLALTAWSMKTAGFPVFAAVLGWPPLVRIFGSFLVGCLLYRVFESGFADSISSGWAGLYAFTVVIFVILFAEEVGLSSRAAFVSFAPSILLGFAVLILSLARNQPPISWLFGNPIMLYLGRISYSIYLIHWLVIISFSPEAWLELPDGTRTLVRILAVIVAAILLHHLVEQPSRRRLRQIFAPKT